MGVPGFFRWICKKYKAVISKIIIDDIDGSVDTLYLDANCLFHPQCFKVLAQYKTEKKSIAFLEKEMKKRILCYIQFLIEYVEPKNVFIAVDGTAPKAKMNQQRSRRFKSAHDAEIMNEIKTRHKKKIDEWSNMCITPGTEFMESLNKALIKFIKNYEGDVKFTLSGYHVPGEGEHKILDDIRTRRKNPSEKDKIFCIYGLDADLIFLAMASQIENLYLLRESVEFKTLKTKPLLTFDEEFSCPEVQEVAQQLDYVDMKELKQSFYNYFCELIYYKANPETKENNMASFGFEDDDTESNVDIVDKGIMETRKRTNKHDLINDFIFICYFLGNDFLPHFPSINIKQDGLDIIVNAYVDIHNMLKGEFIINFNIKEEKLDINLLFLKELLKNLAQQENSFLKKDLPKHLRRLQRRRCPFSNPYDKEVWELNNLVGFVFPEDPIKLGIDEPKDWKYRYYEHYFKTSEHMNKTKNEAIKIYYEGLLWVAKYYFVGCPSFNWQYPYAHAPFISDLYEYILENEDPFKGIEFDKSPPLSPLQQLLAVLPLKGDYLLPKSYKYLVKNDKSPIIDFYPTDFEIDLLYKAMFWEGIPEIPPVDTKRIIEATKGIKLTADEKIRNEVREAIKF